MLVGRVGRDKLRDLTTISVRKRSNPTATRLCGSCQSFETIKVSCRLSQPQRHNRWKTSRSNSPGASTATRYSGKEESHGVPTRRQGNTSPRERPAQLRRKNAYPAT